MERQIGQVGKLCKDYDVPLILSGDIFHKPNAKAELINFAIKQFHEIFSYGAFAIPGQHDLPLHNYEDMKKSAYWSLCLAGAMENLPPKIPVDVNSQLTVVGFPWGTEIEPWKSKIPNGQVCLAVIHDYIWIPGVSYQGAPEGKLASNFNEKLDGFDAAVFGDNHKGFLTSVGNCQVMNCGSFIPRNADEFEYTPQVGFLYSDGSIEQHCLDTKEDKWLEESEIAAMAYKGADFTDFVDSIREVSDAGVDFLENLKIQIQRVEVADAVRKVVLEVAQEVGAGG